MQEILYLSRADVEALNFPMIDIITAVEEAFKESGTGKAEMPPKPGIHPLPDAFIHAMPAYLPGMSAAGIKWVSGYPENFRQGSALHLRVHNLERSEHGCCRLL